MMMRTFTPRFSAPRCGERELVGDEVRHRQVDRALRRGDRQQVHEVRALGAARGGALEHLREERPPASRGGK
jgi:hypothetical protein